MCACGSGLHCACLCSERVWDGYSPFVWGAMQMKVPQSWDGIGKSPYHPGTIFSSLWMVTEWDEDRDKHHMVSS